MFEICDQRQAETTTLSNWISRISTFRYEKRRETRIRFDIKSDKCRTEFFETSHVKRDFMT